MLNTAKGAIHPTLTYDELEIVDILGLELDYNLRIGTSIGGWLINYRVKVWLPDDWAGLMRL